MRMASLTAPIKRVAASHELLWNLTLRELRTKYRKSVLGWTWSMLNPLATVAIYSFVFGHLFGAVAPEGTNSHIATFALYLLCALLPWNFLMLVTNTGMNSLVGNAALVRKVAFPREVLVFANSLHGIVQFSIELGLLTTALVIAGSYFFVWIPVVIVQMVLLMLFASGLALALAAGNVYFRDLSYLWQIFSQVWFFATPIVYMPSLIEGKVPNAVEYVLKLNPMAVFGQGFRRSMYDNTFPGWDNLGACALVALLSMLIGWSIFTKLSRRFAEEL
jgi:ABC-type polysaccharide/polyol phosphate export permease